MASLFLIKIRYELQRTSYHLISLKNFLKIASGQSLISENTRTSILIFQGYTDS
jgi:hypothetical protein